MYHYTEKHQSTQSLVVHSPMAEYQRDDHFFSEEEQLEGYKPHSDGMALNKGLVFSSHICSMLDFIQLFQFMIGQEISLPILHKMRNDSSSNDEKASLFLEAINDDPILVDSLRQDKEQHDKGIMCVVCSCVVMSFAALMNRFIFNVMCMLTLHT